MPSPEARPPALAEYPVVVRLPIQWGDQDAFGHVNNTIPIRWFESARIAYLEQSGVGKLLMDAGLGPILAMVHCNYRQQLCYPDWVQIGARITRLGRSSLTMVHAVYSESLGAVAADGESAVVVFDYSANKPAPLSPEIRGVIEALEKERLS